MRRITCLSVARRTAYGSLESASRRTGIPRSTQQRAEAGRSVSAHTRRLIEASYGATLEDLQARFLGEIVEGNDT